MSAIATAVFYAVHKKNADQNPRPPIVRSTAKAPLIVMPPEIAMYTYLIRYRDVCGRWSVAYAQAASQSDAEAIAIRRYGAFHSVSRAGLVS